MNRAISIASSGLLCASRPMILPRTVFGNEAHRFIASLTMITGVLYVPYSSGRWPTTR